MKLPIDDRLIGCKLFFFLMFYFPAPSARSPFSFPRFNSIHCLCWDCWVVVCPPVLSYGKRSWLSGSVLPIEQTLDLKKAFWWLFRYAAFPFNFSPGRRPHQRCHNGVATTSCGKGIWKKWKVRTEARVTRVIDETSTSTYILLSCNQSLLWIVENVVLRYLKTAFHICESQ